MGGWLESETFWLDLTNIALGLVTLVCLVAVASGVAEELRARLRRTAPQDDGHALLTPELGLTMADGGRRVAEPRATEKKKGLFPRRRRG
jgi:hypothetical protein